MNIFIHDNSEVQTQKIKKNTRIWQYTVILKNAEIGENCNICSHCFIENDVLLGNNVTIKCGVQLWDGIRIEDNVFIGPNVTFTNDIFPRSKQKIQIVNTIVKEGASIGANATIIAGITIGKGAMIGAGSVITKNIPDFTLWYGNPAKFQGYICKCGNKLDENMICVNCSKVYEYKNGSIWLIK